MRVNVLTERIIFICEICVNETVRTLSSTGYKAVCILITSFYLRPIRETYVKTGYMIKYIRRLRTGGEQFSVTYNRYGVYHSVLFDVTLRYQLCITEAIQFGVAIH